MAVKQLPKLSELPEPPDRLVGDQERFDVMTFDSLKAQKKMVNEDLNKTLIPKLNEFAVDVNASVNAAAQSERNAAASAERAEGEANEAASSAATAGTKAGEAAQSAAGAKTSETNAAASKTAAAKSATDAATAQRGAEAARDEARNLANVGYASEAKAGLAKVDGKTTQADAGGMITVEDIAIGGDVADLASERGQIGDVFVITNANANGIIESGNYLLNGTVSGTPNNTPCFLEVLSTGINNLAQICHQISGQRFIYVRTSPDGGASWNGWDALISTRALGDGITVNNGVISVPEYSGATVSAPGTSGLVPPAAAGEQDLFMTGGGNYKSALTKITDSVTSTASDTAASAKAVKSAYDRGSAGITAAGNALNTANSKVSRAGDMMEGRLGGLRGTAQSDASIRYAHSALEIRENSAVGNTQSDVAYAPTIGFHWANKAAGTLALAAEGIFVFLKQDGTRATVDCISTNAIWADGARFTTKLRREGNVDTSWWWSGQGGQPDWVWGSNDGTNMYVYNPSNFNVNYANSAGYAYARFMDVFSFATTNTGVNLPAGGTWLVFAQYYAYGGDYWEVSGKQAPWIRYMAGGNWIEGHRLGFALRIL